MRGGTHIILETGVERFPLGAVGRPPIFARPSRNQPSARLACQAPFWLRLGRAGYFDGEPDWVFGHGLSFTTFDYSNLKVGGSIPGGPLSITADIRNSGKRAGDEVVQLYVRDVEASVKRPKKQLMAFERISLRPGETRSVRFTVSPERLAFWDEKRKAWVVRS